MADKKQSDREQIQAKLKHKREANKRAYLDLMRMGAELEPAAMVMMRIDTLTDLILTEEQKEMFELAFEQRLSRTIETAKTELVKETITKPIKAPGLILPD